MIDIVIASYNRIDHAYKLAQSLSIYGKYVKKIVIVDSSENFEKIKPNSSIINHVYSTHKNQPYQRYLGASLCCSDIVLFLDDDMSLIDNSLFKDLKKKFNDKNISAVNLKFKNTNSFLQNIPKSMLLNKKTKTRLISQLLGYPIVNNNQYSFCGIKGHRKSNKNINFLNGGSFACKLKSLYSNFNFQLFDIYEKRLGKGEDAITGYTISKTGGIWAAEKSYFLHNDYDDSAYSQCYYSFSKRVMYSRLFLSYEYYRLNNKTLFFGFLRFHHYALGRIFSSLINLIMSYNYKRKQIFLGSISGWLSTFTFSFKYIKIENSLWLDRINYDLNNSKLI
jgi:glycosyltransferase involved in cell wall biosynthesis